MSILIKELKALEKMCLDLNKNVLYIVYLSFLKKNLNVQTKPLIKELENSVKNFGILPLYENMQIKDMNRSKKLAENLLEKLKKNKKLVVAIKNHFVSCYFHIFFNMIYFKTLDRLKSFKGICFKNYI